MVVVTPLVVLPLGTLATPQGDAFRFVACFAAEPDRLVRCVLENVSAEEAVERAYETLNALAASGAKVARAEVDRLVEPL